MPGLRSHRANTGIGRACRIASLAFLACTAAALDPEAVFETNEGAVVVIWGANAETGIELQGSGCCVDTAGYVLTVAHQVQGMTAFRARLRDGSERRLQLLDVDASREVALLKSDRPMPIAARIGDAETLRNGAPLVAIAAPVGLTYSVVPGIVSSVERVSAGHPMLQTTIPAGPGSSGGPVFNREGELVGLIVNRLADEQWIKMVTPVNNAYAMLRAHGVFPRPTHYAAGADVELIPASDATGTELLAVRAYNAGVLAEDADAKLAAYGRAISLLPQFFEAWFNLGVASDDAGAPHKAVAAYQTALSLRPGARQSLRILRNLGRVYLAQGRLDEAAKSFEQALEYAPDDASSHNDLGEACRRLGHFERAERHFRQALELRPGYIAARYNLALTYAATGRAEEAVAEFQRYLESRPDASDADKVCQWIEELSAER
ncbi:MAG TPA: serine protease [Candidatus Hydrogenedentes bacterium]|nr:serine protease [Candidatus Hydrogenedentota bacterium]